MMPTYTQSDNENNGEKTRRNYSSTQMQHSLEGIKYSYKRDRAKIAVSIIRRNRSKKKWFANAKKHLKAHTHMYVAVVFSAHCDQFHFILSVSFISLLLLLLWWLLLPFFSLILSYFSYSWIYSPLFYFHFSIAHSIFPGIFLLLFVSCFCRCCCCFF